MSLTDPSVDHRVFQLAVAGAGVIGRRHIELIQASPRTRLCAVVDPTPASVEFAASLGVPHFFSLQDLLAQPRNQLPDGVILATPNHLHVPGALLCAQHGVPALIEKPVADSLQAGQQLADALARESTPMLVGHHRRHSSTLQLARRTIQSGQLGRVVTVMGSAQFYKPDSYFEQAAWRKEAGGQESGWWMPFVEQTLALAAVDPLAAQLDHFCDVVAGQAAPIITVADALQSLRTVEAVRRSIATGQTVVLQDLR